MGTVGDRESTQKMIAELMREAGMLALVFGMLDAMIKSSAGEEHLVHWPWYPALAGVSLSLVGFGVWLERTREEQQ